MDDKSQTIRITSLGILSSRPTSNDIIRITFDGETKTFTRADLPIEVEFKSERLFCWVMQLYYWRKYRQSMN